MFTITKSGSTALDATVDYQTQNDTAVAPGDYTALPVTSVTFAPGETTKQVTVLVNGDTTYETDETFFVQLSNPVSATISDATGIGTILNDDAQPSFAIDDVSHSEGNSGTTEYVFTITKSGNTALDATVDYQTQNDTAVAPVDYTALPVTSVTFAPGETIKQVTVLVNGDTTYEADETFFVQLSNAVGATISDATGVGTILNDDAQPSFAIDDVIHSEGNSGTTEYVFTITKSGNTAFDATVDYQTQDVSAVAPGDYTALPVTSVTFAPGETTKQVTVLVNGDTTYEADETFRVQLSNSVGATISNAIGTGTILNDDAQPSFAIDDVSHSEGNSGTTEYVFTITKSGPTALDATVQYQTQDVSAVAPGDYTALALTSVTFGPAETTKQVTVLVNGDATYEADETFLVQLSNPVGATISDATGTGTILNDDAQPSFAIDDVSHSEGDSGTTEYVFTITKTGSTAFDATVDYQTQNDTAVAPGDYTALPQTSVTFAPGETTKQVTVLVNGDTTYETDETFFVQLSNAVSATISDGTGVGTILNDDGQPSFAIDDVSHSEGNSGTTEYVFTISKSGTTALDATVQYQTQNGSAVAPGDYTALALTSVTFAPAETSKQVTVLVNGDTTYEADETFFVQLSNPVGATISDASGTGTILNDDGQPSFAIDNVTQNEGNSGTTEFIFTVTKSGDTALSATVDYATVDGTAVAPEDYNAIPGDTFVRDTMTGSDGTDLTAHTGETGATWAKVAGTTGSIKLTSNRCKGDSGVVSLYYASGDPASAEYDVEADLYKVSNTDYAGVGGRVSTTEETGYFVWATPGGEWHLVQMLAGVATDLGSYAQALADGTTYHVTLEIRDATKKVFIDGVERISSTDNTITAAGKPAIRYINSDWGLGTTGKALDNFVATNFSATPGPAPTLTFGPGETTKQIIVLVNGDTTFEPNEIFTVHLSNPSGATISGADGTGTIVNDDAPPGFSINDVSHSEGNSGTTSYVFTVTKTGTTALDSSVDFEVQDGTATLTDHDFQASSGTLNFGANETIKQITVLVNGDTTYEANETFIVHLSNAVGVTIGDADGIGTIVNDDAQPSFAIDDVSHSEGNSGTTEYVFTISKTGTTGLDATVEYQTQNVTAVAPGDYTAIPLTSVTFLPGETTKTVTVLVNGDTTYEADETFRVQLSNAVGATISNAIGTGTILNDDAQPSFAIDDVSHNEGNSGTTEYLFTITKSGNTAFDATVSYQTQDVTAVAPGDYAALALTSVTFLPGETTKTVTVLVNGDTTYEADETFRVQLSNAVGATISNGIGTGTILNDDAQPSFAIDDLSHNEGNSGTTEYLFTITKTGNTAFDATVSYQTQDVTAVAPGDYASLPLTSVTFLPGETTKTVAVLVNGDTTYEADETFRVQLSNAVGATISNAIGTGTILNDDAQPSFAIDDVSHNEGNSGTTEYLFTISKTGTTALDATVSYQTQDVTAVAPGDYAALALTSVTFLPGETTKTVTVLVNGDTTYEADETFRVQLSNAVGATISNAIGTGTILNDDAQPSFAIDDVSHNEGNSGTTEVSVYDHQEWEHGLRCDGVLPDARRHRGSAWGLCSVGANKRNIPAG